MEALLKEPGYIYWIKCTLALVETKEPLHKYILNSFSPSYMELISECLDHSKYKHTESCVYKLAFKQTHGKSCGDWEIDTNCSVYEKCFKKILNLHVNQHSDKIYWSNIHLEEVLSSSWAVVKVFMPRGNTACTKPEDTDAVAMFNVLNTCNLFSPDHRVIDKLIKKRNKLMHSANNIIPKEDMEDMFSKLLEFLDFDKWSGETNVKNRRQWQKSTESIKELANADLEITMNLERKALNTKKRSLDDDIAVAETCQENVSMLTKIQKKCKEDIELSTIMDATLESQNKEELETEKKMLVSDNALLKDSTESLGKSVKEERQCRNNYCSEINPQLSKLLTMQNTRLLQKEVYQLRREKAELVQRKSSYERDIKILQEMKEETHKVRAAHDEVEGPYGPQSDEIMTTNSLATRMVQCSTVIKKGNPSPSLLSLPKTENRDARNTAAKIKKYDIGLPPTTVIKERTIMLFGATGTGKSTLVDGIVNYVFGVKWVDPFRFTVTSPEDEESDRQTNQALEWLTCYAINPEKGSRLGYRLNIIDTPGFGETSGQRDQQIINQIRKLFSEEGEKRMVCIDAICFLVKAQDARLTATEYVFHDIMALFGKDVKHNICTLITFTDGVDPPVLAALQQSKVAIGRHFTFNNSGLFAKNVELDSSSPLPMVWDMGNKSFRAFFDCIETIQTKSLQLTKEVLEERKKLERTVQALETQVDAGLSKLNQVKLEQQILDQNKTEIEANKDFEYEVTETTQIRKDLPKGQYVTNCINCNVTCHQNHLHVKNQDEAKCVTMGSDGNCTVCPEKCHLNQHHCTTYILDYVTVKKMQKYQEKIVRYQKAVVERRSLEKVIEGMAAELNELEHVVESLMVTAKECNERLKGISLTSSKHIDLMIEAEKMEKKEGFMARIALLQEFREKADIQSRVESFSKEVAIARSTVLKSVNVKAH